MQGLDLAGQTFGYLTAIKLTEKQNKNIPNSRRKWLCKCKCGNFTMVEQRNLTSTASRICSCGCLTAKSHLIVTSKCSWLTLDYLYQFNDWDKFTFLHKALVKTITLKDINEQYYKQFINHFYNDKQFNNIYSNWKNNINTLNTFYDIYKPSLDHKIPKSRNGTDDLKNLQFLTVFENLIKKDMTWDEWQEFQKTTNTKSQLFYGGDANHELC
jgi:hypothetical protein